MKTKLTILVIVLIAGCADMRPITEQEKTIELVINVNGASKETIYNLTKMWIAENFKSAKSVIEFDDAAKGTLIGNGTIPYPCSGIDCLSKNDWLAHFTMRVDVKDNKFRLTFKNLKLSWPPSYNSVVGAQAGFEGSVSTRSALNDISPELLKIGNKIAVYIRSEKTNDW